MNKLFLVIFLISFSTFANDSKTFVCEGDTDTILMEVAYNQDSKLEILSMVFDETPFTLKDIEVSEGKAIAVPDDAYIHDVLITKNALNLSFKIYNVSDLNEVFIRTDQDFIDCGSK